MHTRYAWAAAITLVVILAGCKQAPPPPAPDTHDADVKAISDLETATVQAIAAKDLDKACAFYADDASLFMPDAHVFNGMPAIKAALKPMLGDKNFSFTISSQKVDVAKSGDLGYGYGAYTMTMTNPKTKKVLTEKGRYVTVYKKQADGGWKAIVDIDSEDARPSPAKKHPSPAKKHRR